MSHAYPCLELSISRQPRTTICFLHSYISGSKALRPCISAGLPISVILFRVIYGLSQSTLLCESASPGSARIPDCSRSVFYLLLRREIHGKKVHILPFLLQGRMNITVQRNIDVCMSQNLAQALYIKPQLHAACGKRMPEAVEIRRRNPTCGNSGFKMVLQGSRFHIAVFRSGQEKTAIRLTVSADQPGQFLRKRDLPDRTIAFGRGDQDLGFCSSLTVSLNPLHGPPDLYASFFR